MGVQHVVDLNDLRIRVSEIRVSRIKTVFSILEKRITRMERVTSPRKTKKQIGQNPPGGGGGGHSSNSAADDYKAQSWYTYLKGTPWPHSQ